MLRVLAWVLGGLLVLVSAAVLALFSIDWDFLRDEAEGALRAAAGRDVRIESLDVRPGWTTRIHLSGLEVDNAAWGKADALVKVERAEVAVELWPLLRGRLRYREIVLIRPVVALEEGEGGRVNWDLSAPAEAAGEAAKPEERTELPAVERIVVRDGRLSYRSPARALELDGKIATGTGDVAGPDRIALNLDGTLEGRPMALRFRGGSILQLRDEAQPYPLDLDIVFGKTKLRARGTARAPLAMQGLDVALALEGSSLSEVFPLLGIPLPTTPPYGLEGRLGREGALWRFENFSGRVGDSDLKGSASLDRTREKPFLAASLTSERLDLDDLGGLIGATPDPQESATAEQKAQAPKGRKVFPDRPVATDRLRTMDMDVRFAGERVIAPDLPVERLRFRVQVRDGRAVANPVSFAVAGGAVSGEMSLDARPETPRATADLTFEGVGLKPFFRDSEFVEEMGGRFFGRAQLAGSGRTLDDVMANADGEGSIVMRDGSVSGLLVEAAGLDVVEALALVIEDARVGIRCGGLDFRTRNGTTELRDVVLDTTDSVIAAQGRISLARERLDLRLEARPKDFSLIDAAAPIRVSGPLTDLAVEIGGIDPLPFFEMGETGDVDCEALFERIKAR